jgi:SAM-dependent methyltransferase
MKTPRKKPHWRDRHRQVANGRLAWCGEPGDERYWYEYWKTRLTPDYYASAEAAPLHTDELGRILLDYLPAQGLLLEAGCGAGYWVAALRARGMDIEGIEFARELVELVHVANPQLPVRWGNALAINRPGEYYAAYLSIGVVEHRVEGPEPFLAEAYRVLKPGGRILIAVPFYGSLRRFKTVMATASAATTITRLCRLIALRYRRDDGKRRHAAHNSEGSALPFFQYGFRRAEFAHLLRKAGFDVEYAQPLYAHRLLQEELAGYDRLASRAPFIKRLAERLLCKRDGHMLMVVGQKLEK